jgi:Putative zinc-finger
MKHFEYEISLLVEDELPEDQKRELLSHLSVCKKCRQTLEDFSKIKQEISQFYDVLPSMPEDIHIQLNNKYRLRYKNSIPRFLGFASILVLFGLILFLINNIVTEKHLQAGIDSHKQDSTMIRDTKLESYVYPNDSYIIFNEVIDSALALRRNYNSFTQIQNEHYEKEIKEFNRVIDSVLYDGNTYLNKFNNIYRSM